MEQSPYCHACLGLVYYTRAGLSTFYQLLLAFETSFCKWSAYSPWNLDSRRVFSHNLAQCCLIGNRCEPEHEGHEAMIALQRGTYLRTAQHMHLHRDVAPDECTL